MADVLGGCFFLIPGPNMRPRVVRRISNIYIWERMDLSLSLSLWCCRWSHEVGVTLCITWHLWTCCCAPPTRRTTASLSISRTIAVSPKIYRQDVRVCVGQQRGIWWVCCTMQRRSLKNVIQKNEISAALAKGGGGGGGCHMGHFGK